MKIKLDEVIYAIDATNDMYQFYLHKDTGVIVICSDDGCGEISVDELEENWDKYIALPTQFEIHEYSIMEDFISTLPKDKQVCLEQVIHGRGVFRRFKDTLYELSLESNWYEYLDKVYRKIAIEWCKKNDIGYVE